LLNPATIILFFVLAIAWAVFGHVDIIATASGKIVPTGRTKRIQPLETGIVSAIYVQPVGRVVAEGVTRLFMIRKRRITLADVCDYVIDPKRRTIDGLRYGTASDTWTYFGAFDFKERKLEFIPASEQRECTPTRGITDIAATRPQGHFDRCHQEELKN
jgi:hypothetical protein